MNYTSLLRLLAASCGTNAVLLFKVRKLARLLAAHRATLVETEHVAQLIFNELPLEKKAAVAAMVNVQMKNYGNFLLDGLL